MGYGEDDCLELALCALLHDASMAWVREDVLTNPEPLTRTGLRAVRRHPLRALATLSDADGLAPAVAIASACVHERLDGSGYPMGLAGEEIAPAARLLAAVDVTVALMAPRPHRREMSAPGAMDLVAAMAADDLLDAAAARAVRRACGL